MNDTRMPCLLISAMLVSLGIATAGYFIGRTLYISKIDINTAEVKGLAEKRVEADRAYWKVQYTVSGSGNTQVSKLYEKSEADQAQILSMLLDSGFDKSEVSPGVINYQ